MITLTVGRFVVDLNKYALLSQDGRGCTAECFKNQVAPMQCNASSWLARGVKKSKSLAIKGFNTTITHVTVIIKKD